MGRANGDSSSTQPQTTRRSGRMSYRDQAREIDRLQRGIDELADKDGVSPDVRHWLRSASGVLDDAAGELEDLRRSARAHKH